MNESVAIVTGAGSGIGRALALKLAEGGHRLALVGRTEAKLRQAAEVIGGLEDVPGGASEPLVLPGDVSDAAFCRHVVAETARQFGHVDVLANVAGHAALCPIDQITPELWRQVVDTNLSAVVNLTAAVWPIFKERQRGFVVNVSSMSSIDPLPGFAAYGAAKAGVNLFTLVAGREGAQIGVKAVCIAPGAVETPMLRGFFTHEQFPAEQCLSPEEVAQTVVDCVTGRRSFDSGTTITVCR